MNENLLKRLLLLAALAAQVPHAAGLFYMISPETGGGYWDVLSMAHALLYAIALEGAVYYFVLRGQQLYSWGFAFASILTNFLFFWSESGMTGLYMARFAVVSIMLPFAIALYSHDNVEDAPITIERSYNEAEETPVATLQPLPDFVPPPLPPVEEVAIHNNIIPFQAQASQSEPQSQRTAIATTAPDPRRAIVEELIANGVLDNATLYNAYGATTEAEKSRVRNIKTAATKQRATA